MSGIFERGRKKPAKPVSTPAGDQQPTLNGAQPGPPSARAAASGDVAEAAAIPANPSDAAGDVPEEVATETAGANAGEDDSGPDQDADPARELLRGLWRGSGAGEDDPLPGDEEKPSGAARAGDAADKEHVSAVQADAKFDWKAYRRAFPDTPFHAAITAMFAEYALLVGRILDTWARPLPLPWTCRTGRRLPNKLKSLCCVMPCPSWDRSPPRRCTSYSPTCSRPCGRTATS